MCQSIAVTVSDMINILLPQIFIVAQSAEFILFLQHEAS